MEYLTPFAIVWVVVFFILGYVRGLWKALGAALSFIGGFAAVALFAPAFARYLIQSVSFVSVGETAATVIAAFVLFIGVGVAIRIIVYFMARSFPVAQASTDCWGGASVSGIYGAFIAIVMVWGASLLIDSIKVQQGVSANQLSYEAKSLPALVVFSRTFVSGMLSWYLRQVGASNDTAQFAAVYAEHPQQVLSAVQESMRSEAFKKIVHSEKIQAIMREQNTVALQTSPEFLELMQQPGVQQLRELFGQEQAGWSDEQVAVQMVDAWSGVEKVKARPDVNALLMDPDVQSFIRDGGTVTPTLLAKGQKLLAIISDDSGPKIEPSPHSMETPPSVNLKSNDNTRDLYEWRDDEGLLHITDYDRVPHNKLDQAQKISL